MLSELAESELAVQAAAQQNKHLTERVAPMVDQQLNDLKRLGSLGELDVLVIMDALTRSLETKVQILEVHVEQATASNRLRTLLRPLKTPASEANHEDK